MGHHVGGRDQVDVVAAPLLQAEHGPGQGGVTDVPPVTPVCYFPVLAEAAQQVAAREKNCARSAAAHQFGLLAVVGAGRVDLDPRRGRADACFAREAIGATAADRAILEAHFLLTPAASFNQGANALVTAAINLGYPNR